MRRFATVMAGLLAIGASATAAPKINTAPDGVPSSFRALAPDRPATDAEVSATHIEGTDFGVLGARGSLGVGLLFGPLGVAGNVAHVQAANKERGAALGDLAKTDLRAMLRDERAQHAPRDAPEQGAANLEIVPVAVANFSSDTDFTLRCKITASYPADDNKPWRGRYSVPIDGAYTTTAINLEETRAALRACFATAYGLYAGHVDGVFNGGSVRTFHVEGIGSKLKGTIVDALLPDRVVLYDSAGLYEYAAQAVTFD